jgi:hypothetical protein
MTAKVWIEPEVTVGLASCFIPNLGLSLNLGLNLNVGLEHATV